MFVRIIQRLSDGRRPEGVDAEIACAGECEGRRDEWCPRRPLCRWRVKANGAELVPYRLHVKLVESKRSGARVAQRHIADLGAIDGHLLPDFAGDLGEEWRRVSIEARARFWRELTERLLRLPRRLDRATTAAIMRAVEARIPRGDEESPGTAVQTVNPAIPFPAKGTE